MKRYISYIVYTVVVALFSVNASAQQIVEGTGEVKDLTVNRASGKLIVDMDIDISKIEVGADETLILTPTIEKNGMSKELPAVEIMGRRAYVRYIRNDETPVTDNPIYSERIAKRAERKVGKKQTVNYITSVPFEEWMRGSNVVVKEGSCGCGNTPIALGNSNVGRVMHELYTPQYVLAYAEPEPEPIKVRAESMSAYINFYVDKYDIVENYKNNATELASVINSIKKVDDDDDLTITSITIDGWASPEATEQHNATLSQNRANSLADYVAVQTKIERDRIAAYGRGEDWAGLRREVEAANDIVEKAKILSIIDDATLTQDQKDKSLTELVPATIYQHLLGQLYPRLRRNDYRIQYNVRNFNIEEAKALVDSDPRKLSVGEMYKVAGTYQKGSAEYNHVMEVAANTYPYIVAAAVNQSALLIADKKYDEALQLLGRSDQNDARILTAQGYAYAGKGDVNKARAAWEKAAAKGSSDAKHNLAELDKYINSL